MKTFLVFLMIILLFGCADHEKTLSEEVSSASEETAEEIPEETPPAEIRFIAPESTTPQVAVMNYFGALYDSYIAMLPVDISPVIDTDREMMQSVQNWNSLLALRRSIISEKGHCYVETERFPYSVGYIDEKELSDERMDHVSLSDYGEGATALHFVIKGVPGKAYPPVFAVNSQHSMIFTLEDGIYKIAYHYFPGSEGKFQNDLPVTVMERDEMEELIAREFSKGESLPAPEEISGIGYDPSAAAQYALSFCEEPNPDFYFVGDWYGNCMNFASQCIWSGFRDEGDTPGNRGAMTGKWYCGKNGGHLVWSSVSRFYEWLSGEHCPMEAAVFYDPGLAENGDLVHTGSFASEEENRYTHALFVADAEKMILAQNSPACFVYYSDLVNSYARFIRPLSLDA